jgi:hypothetical protein
MLLILTMLSGAAVPIDYQVSLDDSHPREARFELSLPPGGGTLAVRHGSQAAPSAVCDRGSLVASGTGRWIVSPECRRVRWTVRLADHDRDGVDAAAPVGRGALQDAGGC